MCAVEESECLCLFNETLEVMSLDVGMKDGNVQKTLHLAFRVSSESASDGSHSPMEPVMALNCKGTGP